MKTLLLSLLPILVLSSCVDTTGLPPGGGPGLPPPEPPVDFPQHPADYHGDPTTAEYRNGYDIGRKDAQFGMPRDPYRAYSRFGRGRQSYFMEGYDHGFYGRPMVH
jgi:hypothetical protein